MLTPPNPRGPGLGANGAGLKVPSFGRSFSRQAWNGLLGIIDFTSGCVKAAPARSALFLLGKVAGGALTPPFDQDYKPDFAAGEEVVTGFRCEGPFRW